MARRTKKAAVEMPKSIDEAIEFVRRIGQLQREIDKITTNLNDKLEKLKAESKESVDVLEAKIAGTFEGLYIYAEGNRPDITDGDKIRIIKVVSGEFGWRMNPPSVEVKDMKKAVKELKEKRLKKLLRIKEEVDKELVLKNKEAVKDLVHINIRQDEVFFVKPAEIQAELFRGKGARKIKKT